jgi:hypothetical protein
MAVVRWTAGVAGSAGRLTAIAAAALVMRTLDAIDAAFSRRTPTATTVPANIDVNLRGRAVARAAWPRPR